VSDENFKSALFKEDDLGSVIRSHLHIEHHLNDILNMLLPFSNNLKPIGLDYAGKVHLCCALGLEPKKAKVLLSLGKMRNKFAHELSFCLDKSTVKNLYEALDQVEKEVLQNSYGKCSKNWSDVGNFKNLPPKSQFVLIAVVIKEMLLKIKVELSETA
jgi:hypothetical protein